MRRIRIEVFTDDEEVPNKVLGMMLAAVLNQIISLEGLTVESFQMDAEDVEELNRIKDKDKNKDRDYKVN